MFVDPRDRGKYQIQIWSLVELGRQTFEMIRAPNIIRVEKSQMAPLGHGHGSVARGPAPATLARNHTNARILELGHAGSRIIAGSIVDDQHLEIAHRLGERRAQRRLDVGAGIARRNDDTQQPRTAFSMAWQTAAGRTARLKSAAITK